MEKEEIAQIIENGESSRIEFKSSDFHNNSLAKEIVAFSNMNGGTIFIGIKDTGEIEELSDKSISI